jgi:hypothetical protein
MPQLKMSEGPNRSAELTTKPGAAKTPVFSFKVFFGAWRPTISFTWLRNALTVAAFSEPECIVFAAAGSLVAHDFPFKCGIRIEPVSQTELR